MKIVQMRDGVTILYEGNLRAAVAQVRAVRMAKALKAAIAHQKMIALSAKKRKLPGWEKFVFFGKHIMWRYVPKYDDRLCEQCEFYSRKIVYFGDAIRAFFPYLKLMDEDTIRVNVHKWCRCILKRFELKVT